MSIKKIITHHGYAGLWPSTEASLLRGFVLHVHTYPYLLRHPNRQLGTSSRRSHFVHLKLQKGRESWQQIVAIATSRFGGVSQSLAESVQLDHIQEISVRYSLSTLTRKPNSGEIDSSKRLITQNFHACK